MNRMKSGCAALLSLGMAAGCGNASASQQTGAQDSLGARTASASGSDRGEGRRMALRDDCDPRDPTWAPTGGCLLEEGDVTRNEFNALLTSPLSTATVGHPAWRIEPTYVKFEGEGTVLVTNEGGRLHTFTEVAAFGGGRVPPLNKGLTSAPECLVPAPAKDVAPGTTLQVSGLAAGNHRFQCCIHPWMRALVKVKPGEADDEQGR